MRVRGKSLGHKISAFMELGYQFAGPNRATRIDFSKMLCNADGLVPHILDIKVRLPNVSFTPAAAPARGLNFLDGVFMATLFGTVKLQAAANSPTATTPGGATILDSIGWRGLQALAYVTGRPVIEAASSRYEQAPIALGAGIPVGPVQQGASYYAIGANRDWDWLPQCGPYVILDSAAAGLTTVVRPTLVLPVGRRRGEPGGLMPIPSAFFTGQPFVSGCNAGSPGFVEITPPSETHGQQLTWDPTGKVDVIVNYILLPKENIDVPLSLKVRETQYSQQRYNTQVGAFSYLAFQNDLDASGNMQPEVYEQVQVTCGTDLIVSQTDIEHDSRQSATDNFVFGDAYRVNYSQSPAEYLAGGANKLVGYTCLGATRFRTPYMMIADGDSSLTRLPGSDALPLTVNVIKGQNTNELIESSYAPRTAEYDNAFGELYALAGRTIFPNTTTGNAPTIGESQAILPGKQISSKG